MEVLGISSQPAALPHAAAHRESRQPRQTPAICRLMQLAAMQLNCAPPLHCFTSMLQNYQSFTIKVTAVACTVLERVGMSNQALVLFSCCVTQDLLLQERNDYTGPASRYEYIFIYKYMYKLSD